MEDEANSLLETRFVLPTDVVILPVTELSEAIRKRFPHSEADFALSRPRVRRPSQIIDAEAAGLLAEFREPSRIADAVARYSRKRGIDAFDTLEAAFGALQSFTQGKLLVPSDSDLAEGVKASFVPGQKVAGFEIARLVQSLEDTELYQATCLKGAAAGPVALKITRPRPDEGLVNMLAREAAVLRHLQGNTVPRLVAEGTWNERHFLACEWRTGLPVSAVASRLRTSAQLRQLHRFCCDVGSAFAQLHEQHVVHGDIHPGNVLGGASICLLDFGLSRLVLPGSPFASAPRSGVAFYYEPEMAGALLAGSPPSPASFAGEQYALAVMIYQLLTGHFPQDFKLAADELLPQIVSSPMLPFSRRGVAPWPEVEAALEVALRKDPEARFSSVREFIIAFARAAPRAAIKRRIATRRASDALIERAGWESDWFQQGLSESPKASFCHGAAGVAYFIHRVALVREDPALLALADAWATRADPRSQEAFTADAVGLPAVAINGDSPYHSAAGLAWVRALIAQARGDARSTAGATSDFLEGIGAPATRMDLFVATPGAVLAAGHLWRVAKDTRLPDYARRFLENCSHAQGPGSGGMAHGAEGVLCAALRACQVASLPLPTWLCDQLEAIATQPMPDHAGWCRGTAGLTMLWLLAHELSRNEKHLLRAAQAARQTWNDSSDQPTLCCGLAGSGFALLRFYQFTGERQWLARAKRLAARSTRHCNLESSQSWSLFNGQLGGALLETELDAPELAEMPLLD